MPVLELTSNFSYQMLSSIPDNRYKKVQLSEFHTIAINKQKLKDCYKGKELSQSFKKVLKNLDIEKDLNQISEAIEIDLEELYNITNHLKWWRIGTFIYKLDSWSYLR
jgi:hypothetical protein